MSDHLPAREELLVYQTENGQVKIDVCLEDETIWLTRQMMAELLQTTQQNISQHIHNILDEGELAFSATHKRFLSVQQEGSRQVSREHDFFNPDMIIAMWLDFAEDQARRRKQVFMKDWKTKLDEFLMFNDRSVLGNAGNVSKDDAEVHAKKEYDHFAARRREYKEQIGITDSIKMLEEAARQIEDKTTESTE